MSRSLTGGRHALEVLVSFDGAVLAGHQLVAGEALTVGRGGLYPLAEGALAERGLAVAGIDAGGAFVQFLDGAEGAVALGEETRSLASLVEARLCPAVVQDDAAMPHGASDGMNALQQGRRTVVRRYALPRGARASFTVGPLLVDVRDSSPAERLPLRRALDVSWTRWLAVAAAVPVLFLAMAFSLPPDAAIASSEGLHIDERMLHARILALAPPPPPPTVRDSEAGGARGSKGTTGDEKAPHHTRGRIRIAGTSPVMNPSGPRTISDARAIARASGVLSVLGNLRPGGAAAVLFDESATALGDATATMNGRLDGTEAGPGWGSGGRGIVGDGPGGGCTGPNCLGTIGVGPGCIGGHCGPGVRGTGPGIPGLRRHAGAPVEILPKEVKIVGDFDKEMVRRVIHAHMNEFRFCYERALAQRPDLAGKLVVGFLIGRDGRVSASVPRENHLGDPGVAQCVAQAVARLTFPMPAGSGMAQVSYPFVFHPAGE